MGVDDSVLDRLTHALTDARNGLTSGKDELEEALASGDPEFIALAQVIRAAGAGARCQTKFVTSATDSALRQLRNGGRSFPYFEWSAINQRSIAFSRNKDFESALTGFRECAEIAYYTSDQELACVSAINIGSLHRNTNRPAEALTCLLPRLRYDGAAPDTLAFGHCFIADLYQDHAYWDLTIEHRRLALELAGPVLSVEMASDLAMNLADRGKITEARQILDAVRLDSLDEETRYFWSQYQIAHGHVLVHEGRPDEAILIVSKALDRIADSEPGKQDLAGRSAIAHALIVTGCPADAIDVLDLADSNRMPIAPLRRHLGLHIRAHRALDDWESVVRYEALLVSDVVDKQMRLSTLSQLRKTLQKNEEIKRRNRLLRSKTSELEQMKVDGDELMEIVANDLQSPLTTLELATGMLLDDVTSATVERCVTWTESAVSRISSIATKLELISAIESENWTSNPEPINLLSTLERSLATFKSSTDEKSIEVTVSAPATTIQPVLDAVALDIVLDNLLSNAVKFTPTGGEIHVTLSGGTSTAAIAVRDNGQGWDRSEEAKLFHKHSRLSAVPTGSEPTSGLGLYIANCLAEILGGELTARSNGIGAGANFTIVMPMSSAHAYRTFSGGAARRTHRPQKPASSGPEL